MADRNGAGCTSSDFDRLKWGKSHKKYLYTSCKEQVVICSKFEYFYLYIVYSMIEIYYTKLYSHASIVCVWVFVWFCVCVCVWIYWEPHIMCTSSCALPSFHAARSPAEERLLWNTSLFQSLQIIDTFKFIWNIWNVGKQPIQFDYTMSCGVLLWAYGTFPRANEIH